jgi:hemoglobin
MVATLYEWAGGEQAFERLINAFYERMLGKHRDLAITPQQRFRFASLMSLAADDAELPEDPEFRSAFVAYVEWGTRLALHNSQPGAAVAEHAPVPRWGWGEAPPYEP